jgi:EAL domain-containing protein (putative c-di-GMP-specific phosphodiesterase class I)
METPQKHQILEELGYIHGQDYLLAQPTPLEETAPLMLQLQRQARSSAQD